MSFWLFQQHFNPSKEIYVELCYYKPKLTNYCLDEYFHSRTTLLSSTDLINIILVTNMTLTWGY